MNSPSRNQINQPHPFRLERPKFDHDAQEREARSLAAQTRKLSKGRDALFHGTRYRAHILANGFLRFSRIGSNSVSFTRSPDVAAYWAAMLREDDEGVGAILIFDRPSLRAKYALEPLYDDLARRDEFEEVVFGRDVEIAPHLIGLVTLELPMLSHKARAVKRTREFHIAAESECTCGSPWRKYSKCAAERREKTERQLERSYPGISRLWLWRKNAADA
jgi:hypothetical protein